MEIYEVFHPIYGITIKTDVPVTAGKFRFLDVKAHEKYVANQYNVDFPHGLFDSDEVCNSCIGVQVVATDVDDAKNKAHICFIHIQNLFRFVLNSLLDFDYDIGIYNYKQPSRDYNLVISRNGDGQSGFHAHGGYRELDISYVLKMNNNIFKTMATLITADVQSQLDKRRLIALDLIGESQHTFGSAISVFQLIAAIDALLGKNVKQQGEFFSNNVARLLETSATAQEKLKVEAKTLYKIRSKIAHGECNSVKLDVCKQASTIAYRVLMEMMCNQDILHMKYFKELETYLDAKVQVQNIE